MARVVKRWRCKFLKCGFDKNWIYADDVQANKSMICMNCGIGTKPKDTGDSGKSWLPCVEL
ncbi:Uncharacterised protein [uncultured archaeon]|nr:Uncharacterised protein [uncultured archaeon]